MARGSQSNFPQAPQPLPCQGTPRLICFRGVRVQWSAHASEKGRLRPRLHQSRGRTRSRQLLRHNRRVKSEPLRPRTAVWLPFLGCPLGHSLPWLPMGWGGLARVLRASPPVVVRPGSTQLSRFEVRPRSTGVSVRQLCRGARHEESNLKPRQRVLPGRTTTGGEARSTRARPPHPMGSQGKLRPSGQPREGSQTAARGRRGSLLTRRLWRKSCRL